MTMQAQISFTRAHRLLLLALLAAVALLAAGCLPSVEDTLGDAPPDFIVVYYFDSGLIPSELTANISGNPSGGGWIIDNSTGGSESDSPSLSSGPFSPTSAANYCIGFDVSEDSSYIEFEYTFLAAGAIFTFAIDGSGSTIAAADQLAWIGYEQSPASGPHTFTWCVSSTATAGPSTLHIDDIEVWP